VLGRNAPETVLAAAVNAEVDRLTPRWLRENLLVKP